MIHLINKYMPNAVLGTWHLSVNQTKTNAFKDPIWEERCRQQTININNLNYIIEGSKVRERKKK